ncbi:MAG: hypothetical protein AVDCRST_MAG08-3787, partial [uncultured Acetobacteraceae bacterium]
ARRRGDRRAGRRVAARLHELGRRPGAAADRGAVLAPPPAHRGPGRHRPRLVRQRHGRAVERREGGRLPPDELRALRRGDRRLRAGLRQRAGEALSGRDQQPPPAVAPDRRAAARRLQRGRGREDHGAEPPPRARRDLAL